MGKYEPLKGYLARQQSAEIRMTFAQVERVLGSPLPMSASEHRPWWANEAHGHVHAKAWLDAGYETINVDMAAKKLTFRRTMKAAKAAALPDRLRHREPVQSGVEKPPRRSPLFGALKGTFTIEPGYDLTQPPMPEWADGLDEKFGPDLPR